MKVLVTGGAGFIGSHLVDTLLKKGHDVTVLDNLETGRKGNFEKHLVDNSFKFVLGSVEDRELLKKIMKNMDIIFHLAANLQGGGGVSSPLSDFKTNVVGTFNLLLTARDYDLKRFVYASSVMVYGGRDKISQSMKEEDNTKLLTPYAASKLTSEKYCKLFNDIYGLKTVSLRYFNVYGPRVRADNPYAGVINKFINKCVMKEPMMIYYSGEQTRDFVEFRDVIRATILASEKDSAVGEIINVGSGVSISINKLAKIIYSSFSETNNGIPEPIYGNPPLEEGSRKGYKHARADLKKAKKILGYEPKIDIKTGIKDLINYYLNS